MKLEDIKNKVISGIYKINYPNGKAYIGQAKNIYKRLVEHNNYAKYGHGNREILLCEQKLNEYNCLIEDFDLLEEINDFSLLDVKEAYWINYYKTYIKDGNGYNLTKGGNASGKSGVEHSNAIFTEETLKEVVNLLQNHTELSLIDIANKYGVEQNTILRISTGKSYINPKLNYPLRHNNHDSQRKDKLNDYGLDENTIIQLKEDILYRWDLTIEIDIPKKWNIPKEIIRDINHGKKFSEYGNFTYPIRGKNVRNKNNLTIQDVKNILNDLKNSKMTMSEIGEKYNFGRAAIRNINNGITYIIKDYNYPARKTIK